MKKPAKKAPPVSKRTTSNAKPSMGDAMRRTLKAEGDAKPTRFKHLEERAARADVVLNVPNSVNVAHQPPDDDGKARPQHGRQVLRQTVSLPPEDHALLMQLEERGRAAGVWGINLSAITRAGLRLLGGMTPADLAATLQSVPPIKAGRKRRAAEVETEGGA